MRERPYLLGADLATRVEAAACRLAEKAARVAANLQARAAERVRARELRAAGRPRVEFVRDLRYGRMTFSFFKHADGRGNVREFWTLGRETPRGRVRLAAGTMREFSDIRSAALRTLYPDRGREQECGPQQARGRGQARGPGQARRPAVEQAAPPRGEQWYALVFIEGRNADGTLKARVVRSVNDPAQAAAVVAKNPKLALCCKPMPGPAPHGTALAVKAEQLIGGPNRVAIAARPGPPRQLVNGQAREQARPKAQEPTLQQISGR